MNAKANFQKHDAVAAPCGEERRNHSRSDFGAPMATESAGASGGVEGESAKAPRNIGELSVERPHGPVCRRLHDLATPLGLELAILLEQAHAEEHERNRRQREHDAEQNRETTRAAQPPSCRWHGKRLLWRICRADG